MKRVCPILMRYEWVIYRKHAGVCILELWNQKICFSNTDYEIVVCSFCLSNKYWMARVRISWQAYMSEKSPSWSWKSDTGSGSLLCEISSPDCAWHMHRLSIWYAKNAVSCPLIRSVHDAMESRWILQRLLLFLMLPAVRKNTSECGFSFSIFSIWTFRGNERFFSSTTLASSLVSDRPTKTPKGWRNAIFTMRI